MLPDQVEAFMKITSQSDIIRANAEGSPGEKETKEPVDPLQTVTLPALKLRVSAAPSAETGLISAVVVQAEGRDDNESQDASRTTAESQAAPAAQKAPEVTRKRTPSVLIIEDTTELAEVIQATLQRMNMIAVTEAHGQKALAMFDQLNPDVVLLDIGLPDMTGWKLLEAVKAKRQDDMPIIIVITAYGDPANRLVGKLQGVYDYLIKPFTADEVERVVEKALRSQAS